MNEREKFMRAMVITRFGTTDVFAERDMKKPSAGVGELLVRVEASGTNPVEAKIRKHGHWAAIEPPAVLGYDVSGVVEQIGEGISDFKVGDEVYYTPEIYKNQLGSYAEYNVVKASIAAHKPKSLSHVEAAAVPLAGGTAWEAIVRRLRVSVGETILIHGGAGGVGSFAVQVARAAGCRVIATAGSANQDTLKNLGVDLPVDYSKQDWKQVCLEATDSQGVDAVFDTVGGELITESLSITKPFGNLAGILGFRGDLTEAYRKNLTLHGVFLVRERKRLQQMAIAIDQGKIKPLVDKVLPLEQVAKAHERLDSGHGRGKIVLKIRD